MQVITALTQTEFRRPLLLTALLALAPTLGSTQDIAGTGESTAATTNRAPIISGTPPTTATVSRSYSFRPTASDADGDTLRFDISNKPAWAYFSRSNGRLYGTPPRSAAGTYANIRIRVNDGKATASLPALHN